MSNVTNTRVAIVCYGFDITDLGVLYKEHNLDGDHRRHAQLVVHWPDGHVDPVLKRNGCFYHGIETEVRLHTVRRLWAHTVKKPIHEDVEARINWHRARLKRGPW